MKVCSWGTVVDKNSNYWIPIYNTDILIKGSKDELFKYVGNLDFKKHGINNKCILKAFDAGDNVVLFARDSYDVWIVNKFTNNINHHKYYDCSKAEIADIVQCDESVVILPYDSDSPTIIWNTNTYDADIVKMNDMPLVNPYAFVRGVANDDYVYSATRSLDNVYIVRINVKSRESIFLKTSLRMVNAMCIKDDNLWLFGLSKNNKTVVQKYNSRKEVEEEYYIKDIDDVSENGYMKYFRICVYENKLFLIPSSNKKIYVYDLETDGGHYLNYPIEDINKSTDKAGYFVEIQSIDSDIILFPYGFESIMKLNLIDETISVMSILFDLETERLISAHIVQSSDVLREGDPIQLVDFINGI